MTRTLTILITALTLLTAGCAGTGIKRMEPARKPKPALSLLGKRANPGDWLGVPLVFRKGDSLTVFPTIDTRYLDLREEKLHVIVKEPFYIMMTLGKKQAEYKKASPAVRKALLRHLRIYLSRDGKRWAPLGKGKALKQLFGIRGGSTSVGMYISGKTGPTLTLGLSLR